jgi:hypothetical protein
MKTLELQKDQAKGLAKVACGERLVSAYSDCAYCRHCTGVRVGRRVIQTPQSQAFKEIQRGLAPDENLMNAALMFNTYVRDGSAIECDDDDGTGFLQRY